MAKLFINGKPISVDVKKSIGKGMEADVYPLGNVAVKVFKGPRHPDLLTDMDREAARTKILEHQDKLRQFPKGLPANVVTPIDLVTDGSGLIIGYTMRLVENPIQVRAFSQVSERMKGIDPNRIPRFFTDLHKTVAGLHTMRVIIGDFNDMNILVTPNDEANVIDADSFQFGKFFCRMYTEDFVDPRLCDKAGKAPILSMMHDPDSDWYAYAAMLFKTLLCVGPFGGVYKPSNKHDQMIHTQRPLRGISVFNPDVVCPKKALHYSVLPDEMLDVFQKTFEKGLRGEFPVRLVSSLRWTKCQACGKEHARRTCPDCKPAVPPAALKETVEVKGKIKATMVFRTPGKIAYATSQDGRMMWVYSDGGKLFRENGVSFANGTVDRGMRFRISGGDTVVGKDGMVAVFKNDKPPSRLVVNQFTGSFPMFDASAAGIFWESGGTIHRGNKMGLDYQPDSIGQVLDCQTVFWAGDHFGFGFYRAGELSVSFTFDSNGRGINDSVPIPRVGGQLLGARCVMSSNSAAVFFSFKDGPKVTNRCVLIKSNGEIIGVAEATEDDGSWLAGIHGKCVIGHSVFSATDDGVIKVDFDGGSVVKETRFDGSEGFVDSSSHLFAVKDGLCCVSEKEIRTLQVYRS